MSESVIQWASSDAPDADREDALAAAREIAASLGMAVSPVIIDKIADKIQVVAGVAERRAYDVGWRHCYNAIRE